MYSIRNFPHRSDEDKSEWRKRKYSSSNNDNNNDNKPYFTFDYTTNDHEITTNKKEEEKEGKSKEHTKVKGIQLMKRKIKEYPPKKTPKVICLDRIVSNVTSYYLQDHPEAFQNDNSYATSTTTTTTIYNSQIDEDYYSSAPPSYASFSEPFVAVRYPGSRTTSAAVTTKRSSYAWEIPIESDEELLGDDSPLLELSNSNEEDGENEDYSTMFYGRNRNRYWDLYEEEFPKNKLP
ncbi:hypothetical protein ABK040_007080 [Willaertia magna]